MPFTSKNIFNYIASIAIMDYNKLAYYYRKHNIHAIYPMKELLVGIFMLAYSAVNKNPKICNCVVQK